MECVLQVMCMRTGCRAPAAKQSRTEFADALDKHFSENRDEFGVLVLMDTAKGEFDFSQAPFLTVTNFIALFGSDYDGKVFSATDQQSA